MCRSSKTKTKLVLPLQKQQLFYSTLLINQLLFHALVHFVFQRTEYQHNHHILGDSVCSSHHKSSSYQHTGTKTAFLLLSWWISQTRASKNLWLFETQYNFWNQERQEFNANPPQTMATIIYNTNNITSDKEALQKKCWNEEQKCMIN